MMPAATTMKLLVGGWEIPDIKTFSYTEDVRQIGNPFSCEIPDPYSRNSKDVVKGAKVQVYLSNPEVNGGKETLKLTGRIRNVKQVTRRGEGRVLRVTGSDLGIHLVKSCGPLYFNLQRTTYKGLLAAVLDPSWGFRGTRLENDTNRRIILGRAQQLLGITNNGLVPLQYIGIEPGESIADVLTQVARFAGIMVNVSADGCLQGWNPNYQRAPLYQFHLHAADEPESVKNNVDAVEVDSSADELYTHVTCVGELLFNDFKTGDDPHAGKKRGHYKDTSLLPYRQSLTFVDPEQEDSKASQRCAEWRSKQQQYDAWTYGVSVPYHHQGGIWYATDTIAAVDDSTNYDDADPSDPVPIKGNYYVAALTMHWDEQKGGGTQLSIKRAGLLKAPTTSTTPKSRRF